MVLARLRRNEHGLGALALALLLNVMFFPYIWGNMNLMSGANDAESVTILGGPNGNPNHPVDQKRWKLLDANGSGTIDEPTFPLVHHQLFAEHEVPLWNPDMAFGTPLAAEMQQEPFFPLTGVVMVAPGPSKFAAYIALRLFVAGFATYLFLRFFVGFLPALGGGIAYMLNGYFIKYSTMPHLSVETLTGALFLGVEFVLRRRRPWLAVPFLAVVVWLDFLGGMPESSFINIVFASIYGVFRVLSVPAYRAAWAVRLRDFSLAMACGFACAAFLLLPFGEFVVNSFNVHEPSKNGGSLPGLVPDSSPTTSLAIYALPMLFGPPWQAIGIPFNDGYFGVTLIFCALAAMAYGILCRRSAHAVPIAFFSASLVLLTAKRYGVPAVNWIGGLPIVRVIALTKYQEAATAFAMAALVAFGLHALFVNRDRRRTIAFCAFAVMLAFLQLIYDVESQRTSAGQPRAATYFFIALTSGLLAFAAIAALAALAARYASPLRERVYAGLAVLAIATEMSFNYFVPMYYLVDPGPSKLQNPYLGAAYIDWLHRMTNHGERIYAEHTATLQPDWAQAFDLKDVRDIDAIYVDRYLPFGRAFIPENHTDLLEDFNGSGPYSMATPVGRKFLSLGSVRYIISPDMLDPTTIGARIRTGLLTGEGSQNPGFAPGTFALGGRWLDGFAQAYGARPLRYTFDMLRNVRWITVSLGVPATFSTLPGTHSDFTLRLTDARGVPHTLLARRYDGRRAGRGWERYDVDVARYAGTRVTLSFEIRTNGAAAGTAGYWGDVRQEPTRGEGSPFALVKQFPENNVFEFAHPLPHGALYDNVTLSSGAQATLDTLTSPAFDVFRSAVVARGDVPNALAADVGRLARQKPSNARAATLRTYTATDVSYATEGTKPSLFFLSDTYYPGWKAFVDNRETPVLRTNYLFRGVVLGPGKHVVEFRYQPLTFRIGLVLCAGGLLALGAFAFFSKRRSALKPPDVRTTALAEV